MVTVLSAFALPALKSCVPTVPVEILRSLTHCTLTKGVLGKSHEEPLFWVLLMSSVVGWLSLLAPLKGFIERRMR